ncbi:MAG TPA: FHA domain-containing protein [Gammaproteobacteria bacterium]
MSKLTLYFKEKVLKVYPLPEGEALIGSDPGCLLHIDSLAVQPRHACVTTHGEKSLLRDLGTADGTFVNGKKLSGDYTLRDDDVVRVGKHDLIFTQEVALETIRTEAVEEILQEEELKLEPIRELKSGWLQLMSGSNVGKTISLSRNLTNLGTPGVQTAVVARRSDGYFLSHLEGEHPPTVGGVSIGDSSWHLQDGDVIQMGNVKMQFYLQ